MSDIEHEFVVENQTLRDDAARLRALAERAVDAAIAAQDAQSGRHDAWLDDARCEIAAGMVTDPSR